MQDCDLSTQGNGYSRDRRISSLTVCVFGQIKINVGPPKFDRESACELPRCKTRLNRSHHWQIKCCKLNRIEEPRNPSPSLFLSYLKNIHWFLFVGFFLQPFHSFALKYCTLHVNDKNMHTQCPFCCCFYKVVMKSKSVC